MLRVCRNQLIDLEYKSIDWFLYDCSIGLIWVEPNKSRFIRNIAGFLKYISDPSRNYTSSIKQIKLINFYSPEIIREPMVF